MLSLRAFHIFFIALSIVLTGAVGMWGLLNHDLWLGAVSLTLSGLLVIYEAYFAAHT